MVFHSAGGYNLHTTCWLPDGDLKGVVVIAHGLAEHSGRYQHVAAYLNQADYGVYALDHYGHGQSDGRRCYFDDLNQPVRDLAQFLQFVPSQHPDHPLWLYGHSMGVLIALLVALDYQITLSGLILSGSPLDLHTLYPDFFASAAARLDPFVPWLPVAPSVANGISCDPAEVKRYKADPLIYHGPVRLRMAHFLFAQSAHILARLHELRLPLLILHGGKDKICPWSGSHVLHASAASTDKRVTIYGPSCHEIHQEPDRLIMFENIVTWLDERS